MKVLLFGADGQLGREILRRAGEVEAHGRATADFTDPEACAARVAETGADVVINAAAYTAVDRAEEEEALARRINATTPGALAEAAAARGLPFVHVSTDYVFDGAGETPFTPDHPTGPLGAYGRTKLAGEQAVRGAMEALGGPHAILRTSWVVSAHGQNFVKTMLRLAETRDRLSVVADQVGGPTPAADLARACLAAAQGLLEDPGRTGTHHVSGAPDVSWAGFARETFAQAGRAVEVVEIPTSEYPTPAVRPLNSRLDNSSFEAAFGLPRPDWRVGLAEILRELGARS